MHVFFCFFLIFWLTQSGDRKKIEALVELIVIEQENRSLSIQIPSTSEQAPPTHTAHTPNLRAWVAAQRPIGLVERLVLPTLCRESRKHAALQSLVEDIAQLLSHSALSQ